MNRVVLFELSSQQPERQASFYSNVFGWELSEPQWGYRSATTGPSDSRGIDGGIAQGPSEFPQATRITIQVDSIDDALNKAIENGATISQAKLDFGSFFLVYIVDPVGVHIGLIQYK